MSLDTKPLGSSSASFVCHMYSSSWIFTSIFKCIQRQGIFPLPIVHTKWMAMAYESIKLDSCLNYWKNRYSKIGRSFVTKFVGSLRVSCFFRPCLSLWTFTNLLWRLYLGSHKPNVVSLASSPYQSWSFLFLAMVTSVNPSHFAILLVGSPHCGPYSSYEGNQPSYFAFATCPLIDNPLLDVDFHS